MKKILAIMFLLAFVSLACVFSATPATVAENTHVPATETPIPAATFTVTATEYARVTALRFLNIRESAGYQSTAIGYLQNGDPVTLTGICLDGWAEIKIEDGIGWVNSRYITGGCDG